jgi:hypothetical protein
MKKLSYAIVALAALVQSCNTSDNRYIDLNTGKTVHLEKEASSGLLVDTATKKHVKLYVDTKSGDTIWGRTGEVVNGKVHRIKRDNGEYTFTYGDDRSADEPKSERSSGTDQHDGEHKVKNGDYKKEVEKDGDVIIKDGNKKIKIDGETGERKVKYDN